MKRPEPEFVQLLHRLITSSFGFEENTWEHWAMSIMQNRGWVSVKEIRPGTGLWLATPKGRLVLLIADALKGAS